jgi:23S rRNA-/tRNA-specific pseudouridylate synthase
MVSTAVFLFILTKLTGQLCGGLQWWSRVLQKKDQFQSHVLRLSTSSENTQFSSNGQWIAEKSNTGLRLSSFLNLVAPELFSTQTASKNAVRKGLIRLNGLKALTTDLITNGDIVESYIRSQQGAFCSDFERRADECPLAFELIRVPVVWEDDHCAVVIKPQGMPVFRTKEITNPAESADRDMTTSLCLQSALPYSLLPVSLDGKLQPLRRPQAVHRLDKGTGGLLLVAKTRPALINLTAQFADRTIKKKYLAIVVGKLSEPNNSNLSGLTDTVDGVISAPLSGQSAETHWHVEPDMYTMSPLYGCITTVNLEPLTGRTHQLRR